MSNIENHIVEIDYESVVYIVTVLHQNDEYIYGLDTVTGNLVTFKRSRAKILEVKSS